MITKKKKLAKPTECVRSAFTIFDRAIDQSSSK